MKAVPLVGGIVLVPDEKKEAQGTAINMNEKEREREQHRIGSHTEFSSLGLPAGVTVPSGGLQSFYLVCHPYQRGVTSEVRCLVVPQSLWKGWRLSQSTTYTRRKITEHKPG